MEWTQDHDLMLLRETAFEDPFQFKKGSPDRGEVWSKIARSLNSSAELKFAVKQRSVRERFALLQAKYKEKNKKDEASSGTSTQMSELDRLLEDITEKEKDSEESRNAAAAKKDNQDREKAESIRKTAMERVSQTKKRQEGTEREAVSTKRRRRGGDDTIEYLREKSEAERKVREQELELKKAEVALQEKRAEQGQTQMQEMLRVMQQQQQQSQNMTALLMQQQQHFMNVMQSLLKKPQ